MRALKRLILVILFFAAVFILSEFLHNAEAFQYESKGKRDPFVPLVGAEKPAAARLVDITSVEDLKLDGIALGARGEAAAIINGELVKSGDKVGDITVKSITKTTVTLIISGKAHELNLQEEGGQKE
jgi:hypothetical protein